MATPAHWSEHGDEKGLAEYVGSAYMQPTLPGQRFCDTSLNVPP
jgi:hypothetical protein